MRRRGRPVWRAVATFSVVLLAGCSPRLEHKQDSPAAPEIPSAQLASWSQAHSGPYGIPERALQAYAYAAAIMDRSAPNCGIGWPTLAAIGSVMSNHGRAGNASILGDGKVTPAERNLGLADPDKAKEVVQDTDGGKLDGRQGVDVPMGPFQFYPSRWEQWSTDANGDGNADPDNIDDAALSAARFLCAVGGDLRQSDGWTRAVQQFYPSAMFLLKVHDVSTTYSR